jgi:uncharacterized membrane protein
MITSEPRGAKVFVNGAYVGKTPLAWSDTKPSLTCTPLKLQKNGYEDFEGFLCKDEELNVGALIGGMFCWPVWIWAYKYFPEHHYILKTMQNDSLKYTVDDSEWSKSTQNDEIETLKKLYSEGILTKEEYEKAKEKIEKGKK